MDTIFLLATLNCPQKSLSVAHIIHPEVIDEGTGRPRQGGLMDPRMGTIDRSVAAETVLLDSL